MLKKAGILVGALIAFNVWALMPHEVLLLVNRQSPASLQVANTYAAARQIPQHNMVYLDVPERIYGGTATLTPEEFTQLIWEPANAAAKERGLDHQILAWVYSVDFPIRVKTAEKDRRQMSVGGLTFLRNQIPDLDQVEEGTYASRLFLGPNRNLKLSLTSLSLRTFKVGLGDAGTIPEDVQYLRQGLGDQMPLPSMMLGYIGENGTDVQTVLDMIERGARSDHRGTRDGIYFVQTEDEKRSLPREALFYPTVNELKQRGITAVVTNSLPAGAENVMGILTGAETVDPSAIQSFAPGAMADHFTSWSAEFQKPQTKMTEWIKAGATGSAGMVVEPYNNADKFPTARFFGHYSAGTTMLESFYLSIASPLQNLLLGDPLARPYAPKVGVRILGMDEISDDFTYIAKAESRLPNAEYRYSFLLDGKPFGAASEDPAVWISTSMLADGYHELRAIAWPKHPVEFGGMTEKAFTVNTQGRSIAIDAGKIVKTGDYTHAIPIRITGQQVPKIVRLICGDLVLDEKEYVETVTLLLDEKRVGEGPNRFQVVAVYADGTEVSSPPLRVSIAFAPKAP
jgi:hypothetical protein